MPDPRKSQKQIAQKYAENLRYFRHLHPFRRARILLVLGCLLISVVAAVIYLINAQSSRRLEWLNSSGSISQAHSRFAQDCKQCHDPVSQLNFLRPSVTNAAIDASCLKCHTQHTFHVADTVVDHSCTACHHEHMGPGPMQPVADSNCQSCHGNAAIMAASAQKGLQLPASDFQVKPADIHLVYFQPPRPAQGYTQVFQSFEGDHPAFQIQSEHLTDPNTLKFNHKIHLSGDIPEVDGHKLDCAYCHKPDSRGAYMQPISFAANCQACHALQIDPTLPDFQIPHPTGAAGVDSVRNFLLTLPTQYANYAMEKKGLTNSTQVADFVNQHMTGIRDRIRQGADLEKEVFFADQRQVNFGVATPSEARDRALFPGCAYCHEVKPSSAHEPIVTKPVTPDRWYVHARFDHAAHSTMSCEACHGQVLQSTLTSDISLPDKASCVTCHSAKGGVVATCATCHDYHNKAPAPDVASESSLRKMMLGGP
jgi:hypothetical protein